MPSPVFIRIGSSRAPANPFVRIVAGLLTLLGVVALLMMSVVAVGVLLVGVAGFGLWLWWKTRALRRTLREQAAQQQAPFARQRPAANDDSMVIEGESIREVPEQEDEAPRR